jgi:hypothetical protein
MTPYCAPISAPPRKRVIPTVSGWALAPARKSAKRYSFHEMMNTSMASAMTPERTTGSDTLQNSRQGEQPSTMPASSSSRGTVAKKPTSIHVANGM